MAPAVHHTQTSFRSDGPRQPDYLNIALIVIIFSLAVMSRSVVFAWDPYRDWYRQLPEILQWIEQPFRWFLLCWLGLFIAHRSSFLKALASLGLFKPVGPAILFSFIACLPMLIVPLIFGSVSSELSLLSLLFYAGVWPLAEEILYRGYAFKQFYQSGRLGFWPAALLTGLVFGLVHLGQASVQAMDLAGEMGTVAIISLGGILSAWLFKKWDFNLWVPFGMHMLMNLWWNVFDMSDTPLGDWGANLLRLLTVVIAIVLTAMKERIPVFAKRAA